MSTHTAATPVTALIARLAAYAGFDEEILGSARMDSIIARRRRLKQAASTEQYLALVEKDSAEHDALLHEVLVGETKFFRDERVFAHLQKWLTQRRKEAGAGKEFRVLCAPCSTGEEAYSVAASLQAAEFAAGEYAIEALEISRSALEVAERGVYTTHALRGVSDDRREQLVRRAGEQWSVLPRLKAGITFSFANLSLPQSLQPMGTFDLILCRNLLIYLRPETRLNLLQSLHAALRPGGRLIVGTGDAVPEIYTMFQPARPASSFMLEVKAQAKPVVKAAVKTAAKTGVRSFAPAALPVAAAVRSADDLHTPQEFYRRAQAYLRDEDLRAAERCCRKALYLQPADVPSLELLEQLWQNEPASRRSRALTERLGRARAGQGGA